jgi:chaperonin GroES
MAKTDARQNDYLKNRQESIMILDSGRTIEVVGDRVLIRPDEGEERTKVGLYLPRPAAEKTTVQGGTVVEIGPGIPVPEPPAVEDEPWRLQETSGRHVPPQARVGDYAVFLRKPAVEVRLDGEPYLVVPQAAILVLVREDVSDL